MSVKWKISWLRLIYFMETWPVRFRNLFLHMVHPGRVLWLVLTKQDARSKAFRINPLFWLLGLCLLVLDLLGIPELYETVTELFKPDVRSLKEEEIAHYRKIFGNEIAWDLVRIDTQARIGPKKWRLAYVSFHTINSWGELTFPIMVHELVHVWQYQKFGSLYIALALQAQFSPERYDYGGLSQLIRKQGLPFAFAFNFEQQAEIVEDFYRSKQNLPLQWTPKTATSEYWLTYWVRRGLTGNQFDPTE